MAHSQPLRVGEKPWVKWSLIALALLLVGRTAADPTAEHFPTSVR
ncbi:sulfate ABC transporter, permease protein [Vibrio cholerae]|nr:sulfate ABC transporter, permease protein [Vibrio cholerae]